MANKLYISEMFALEFCGKVKWHKDRVLGHKKFGGNDVLFFCNTML